MQSIEHSSLSTALVETDQDIGVYIRTETYQDG